MRLSAGAATHRGRVREKNEDAVFVGRAVFGVADGLGGHRAGEVASRLAVECLAELERVGGTLEGCFREANRRIIRAAAESGDLKGMATTLTAVAVGDGYMDLAHVGDTRAYLYRAGTLTRLTTDHTLVQDMVDAGGLSEEEAERHPQRSVLLRALGVEERLEVDRARIPLQEGDRILLCSDGLTSVVSEEEIAGVLAGVGEPRAAAQVLVERANAAGGPDNVSVVVVDVKEAGRARSGEARDWATAFARVAAGRRVTPPLPRRKRRWRKILAVLVLGVVVGGAAWQVVRNQYFVGVWEGKLAVYSGVPQSLLGRRLARLVEVTTLPLEEVDPMYRRKVEEGIPARNLEDARRIVREMPRAGGNLPTPSPGAPGGS